MPDTKPQSMGYPALEKLIDQPNPDLSGMKAHYEALKELAKTAKSAKEKGAARQASLAYQRFFELWDNLLQIKAKMVEESQAKKGPSKPAPKKK